MSDSTDAGLILQCAINATIDPSCSCLLSGGGPELNTDISGPGVRISFYLQALVLALTAAVSDKAGDIANALYTLVMTNVAMVVASLILGFKKEPGMSLHDAVVVIYLITISWTAIFFSIPAYNKHRSKEDASLASNLLGIVYIFHSYLIFAFTLPVLVTAHTFGSTWRCNSHAVVVIFKAFPAFNEGRILALVVLAIIFFTYTVLLIADYGLFERARFAALVGWCAEKVNIKWRMPEPPEQIMTEGARRAKQERKNSRRQGSHDQGMTGRSLTGPRPEDTLHRPFRVAGSSMFQLALIIILWSVSVMNTELLIVRNDFVGGGNGIGPSLWGFGQILPMFLVALPLFNLIEVLVEKVCGKGQRPRPVHRVRVKIGTLFRLLMGLGVRDHERGHGTGFSQHSPFAASPTDSHEVPYMVQYAGTENTRGAGRSRTVHISSTSPQSFNPANANLASFTTTRGENRIVEEPRTGTRLILDVPSRPDPRRSNTTLSSTSSYATARGDDNV